jgi:hypothetical protein
VGRRRATTRLGGGFRVLRSAVARSRALDVVDVLSIDVDDGAEREAR